MASKFNRALLFTAALLPIAAIGGLFVSIYSLEIYDHIIREQILTSVGGYGVLLAIGVMQTVAISSFCAFFGYLLAEKMNLMKTLRFEKTKLIRTIAITFICGVLFSMDYWVFAKAIPQLYVLYGIKITVSNILASIFYGGVIEEVLMRLFLMSLFAYLLWKLFARKHSVERIPGSIYIAANILSATLFAAGHLPATVSIFGELSPLILFRCFLLNGGLGFVFGWLYYKYGIQYAALAHMGCHMISKSIWLIFI